MSTDPAALKACGDQFGIDRHYTSYDDVLADRDVDFVHINSPIPDHARCGAEGSGRGKHVMCTVPMATTIEDCRQIVEKVNKTGLKYMMAETVVYSREFLFIRDLYPCAANSAKFSTLRRRIRRIWMAGRVTGKNDPDALCNTCRQPLPWTR